MSNASFKPVIYVKEGCPYSFKVRLFLLEAGLLDRVELRAFVPGSDKEQAVHSELDPHFEKVGIPAAQIAPGHYMKDSDAIIAKLAENAGIDPERLSTLKSYSRGVFKKFLELFKENKELKKQA